MIHLVFLHSDGYPDIKMNVKFVQDTSKYWYKPDISREQGESWIYQTMHHYEFIDLKVKENKITVTDILHLIKFSTTQYIDFALPFILRSSSHFVISLLFSNLVLVPLFGLLSPFSHQPVEGQGARGLRHKGQPFFPWGLRSGHEGCVPPTNCPTEQKR